MVFCIWPVWCEGCGVECCCVCSGNVVVVNVVVVGYVWGVLKIVVVEFVMTRCRWWWWRLMWLCFAFVGSSCGICSCGYGCGGVLGGGGVSFVGHIFGAGFVGGGDCWSVAVPLGYALSFIPFVVFSLVARLVANGSGGNLSGGDFGGMGWCLDMALRLRWCFGFGSVYIRKLWFIILVWHAFRMASGSVCMYVFCVCLICPTPLFPATASLARGMC